MARGAGQGHDPRVAEAQGWGPPALLEGGTRDPLKGWARKDTALTDAFSIQQPMVDRAGGVLEFFEVVQPPADPQVGR
jgi:hypothetical protein